jgi:preprotein translocase subunit SecA
MILNIVKKFLGSSNERYLKKLTKTIGAINQFEPTLQNYSDEQLKEQTHKFKARLANGETLNDLLPEAFATVREVSKRTLGMRHYDVQMIGGLVLHQGMIAEMKTGEGKTLMSTLAAYLNALTGKGVHLVTVNDYLAARDADWMRPIYDFLGITVGVIVHDMSDADRRAAYHADITYGTNNEFGFDYLRDNMKFHLNDMVQRPFQYAIVDEIDSILIDEARTPLIISGAAEDSSLLYIEANKVLEKFKPEDYEKDEKQNNVTLTEAGIEKTEKLLRQAGLLTEGSSLYDVQNLSLVHHIGQALRAHTLYHKDKEYIIKDMKILIIDEFTGRMMDGRRYSDGLHQAIEAKEGVPVQMENQTLASITFQNYFRLYPKLSGMGGTVMTEATEFGDIYRLEVVEIPTHVPVARKDHDDEVYRTAREKMHAITTLIEECRKRQQPVLVGTASIEKSEEISAELKRLKIPHNVLNARYHEQEAHIVAESGKPGAITVATNMAGRGTDIKLGGNLGVRIAQELGDMAAGAKRDTAIEKLKADLAADAEKVRQAGGLYVIGTERHESRRIDNQLRGRSGRQGDPGASKFFLSLEDDLMRIFAASSRLDTWLQRAGLKEGEAITHPIINRTLEKAQQKVEARNYDTRKHLLKYDDVMNDQRKVIYEQRREIMNADTIHDTIEEMRDEVVTGLIERNVPEKTHHSEWDLDALHEECKRIFGLTLPLKNWVEKEGPQKNQLLSKILVETQVAYQEKFKNHPKDVVNMIEKSIMLRILDQQWKDHLLSLDQIRQGINLRAYAQKDPLNEYKREAFEMFMHMLGQAREGVLSILYQFNFEPETQEEELAPEPVANVRELRDENDIGEEAGPRSRKAAEKVNPKDPSTWGRVQRNSPCPCGSGRKYKQCHGQLE